MTGSSGRRRCAAASLAVALAVVSCASEDGGEPETDLDRSETCPSPHLDGGGRTLFDGSRESLDRWRMAGPGEFVLQDDGSLRTRGGLGLLWYPEEFDSYRLVLEWKVAGDDNSGIFVGFPEPGDDPRLAVDHGYEIQIDATDEPDRTTGAIYAVQAPDVEARDAALNPPGEWNAYEIVVAAETVVVHLNGVSINRFQIAESGRDLTPGHLGLQNHGPGDEVYFRDIRVRPC